MWRVRKNLKKTKRRVRDGDPRLVRVLDEHGQPYMFDPLSNPMLLLKALLLKYGELVVENGLLDRAKLYDVYFTNTGGEVVVAAYPVPAERKHRDDPWPPEQSVLLSDFKEPKMVIELTPLEKT